MSSTNSPPIRLSGAKKGNRGKAHKAAVALGMKVAFEAE